MLPPRFLAYALSLLATLAGVLLWHRGGAWPVLAVVAGALAAVGTLDLIQTRHAIRRNYPILAHVRFLIEAIRPELRQYLLEGDTEEQPFSRAQRALVYQRAKNVVDKRPFGTQLSVYASGYEWINHSMVPAAPDSHDFRVQIGGADCTRPYACSVFNISAMSFGALSANAVLALNAGAKRGGFYHDTGEGSISCHHRVHGGDLVWEIGSGYFGCRHPDGRFSAERFAENAADPQVKMIELKLSQGAKPGHGGVLPGAKVTEEIAAARGVPVGTDCISPARHSAFTTPIEMLEFIARLRQLSGGKPTGFKLAVGHPWELFALAKAMLATGILPDFIVVDGGEGGTGAAPLEFSDHVGMPLREALLLVHNTLIGSGLRSRIKLGAAGKIVSAFDLARVSALGADWANSARGFMFALGCIQAQSCHTGSCPTGVTTQDALRQRALVVPDKAARVYQFHRNTLIALKELLAAAGLTHPDQLGPEHVLKRTGQSAIQSFAELYPTLPDGALLDAGAGSAASMHPVFRQFWSSANAESFAPPAGVQALWGSKLH